MAGPIGCSAPNVWWFAPHWGLVSIPWALQAQVIIIDGANQAKFRVLKATRLPKALEGEFRPRVNCVGTWAHEHFTLVEQNMERGSNLTLKIIVRALDLALSASGDDGKPFPTHFWLQCDSAWGEHKHRWEQRFLAVLVDRWVFLSAVGSTLQVGHTHEDVDGLFMSMEIATAMGWNHPAQMAEIVQRRMLGTLDAVCAWKSWLTPLDDLDPKHGIAGLMSSNTHWLCFTMRADLPVGLAGAPAAGGDTSAPAAGGVTCMAKEYMSSLTFMQEVLTMCKAGKSCLLAEAPISLLPRKGFSPKDYTDACRLAEKVRQYLPEHLAAIRYIDAWMANIDPPAEAPPVPAILQHRWHRQQGSEPIGPVLERAVLAGTTGEPRLLSLKRRKVAVQTMDLPLTTYVTFRQGQGISAVQAVQEWNGAQLVGRQPG